MSLKRLKVEGKLMAKKAPEGCSAAPEGENLYKWSASIDGPVIFFLQDFQKGTPYEGGVFFLSVEFPRDYPFKPPKIKFVTRLYHPNVINSGENTGKICMSILGDEWSPSLKLGQVLTSIRSLLDDPNGEDAAVPEIGKLLLSDKKKFEENAKAWTKKYAT